MRNEFDLDETCIYLNSGTHSICPRIVAEAVTRYQRSYELNPTDGLHEAWPQLWEIQKQVGNFFHADPQDLFLRANVTAVLNTFILGAPLPRGSEILTTDLEYGAVTNICSFRAERDHLKLRNIHLPTTEKALNDLTVEGLTALVTSQIRPETRMLVLSHVMAGTGLCLPIAEIAHHTRSAGVLLVVNGAHAAGAVPLNFQKLQDLDFYGGNLHKWMMAPKGTAFGWVAQRHHDTLDPITVGWTTFETSEYYSNFGEGSRFQGRFLMHGCHDFAPFLALHDTLEFWNKHGSEAIVSRIYALQKHLELLVDEELKWPCVSPPFGPFRGPLLAYELPANLQQMGASLMFQIFREHRLQIAILSVQDKLCLRFSPHIYNNNEELGKAIQILSGI